MTANDIWFTLTPRESGSLMISTCDQADCDTDLIIYGNTDGADLQFLACNDDYAGAPHEPAQGRGFRLAMLRDELDGRVVVGGEVA